MDHVALTATIAYSLFEHRGHVHGRDRDDWLQAERILAACAALTVQAPGRAAPRQVATELASTDLERRALEVLADAAARDGRAATAAALGYASTGVVSDVLRGKRALKRDLAERILAAFEPPALAPALRVLAREDEAARASA